MTLPNRLSAVSESASRVGSPLAMKLASVMAEVSRVPKRGHNDFHNYDYPLESDILDAIREKLADRNVMWLPSIENVEREGTLTTVIGKVTFVDAESGEERTIGMVGTGEDKGDKGVYKAFTGAVKYCLLKTFMISTGDDPESDVETDRSAHGQQVEQRRQGSNRRPSQQGQSRQGRVHPSQEQPTRSQLANKAQIREAYEFGRKLGLSDAVLGRMLKEVRGQASTEGITVDEIASWKQKMAGNQQAVS